VLRIVREERFRPVVQENVHEADREDASTDAEIPDLQRVRD
jgi:hypothetical protein